MTQGAARLNIEGAVVSGGRLELFHRGNDARDAGRAPCNAIAEVECREFAAWLDGGAAASPRVVKVTTVDLGDVDGIPFGFTDAVALDDEHIVVLACAEDSASAISDGAVLGCRVGVLDARGLRLADVYDASGRSARASSSKASSGARARAPSSTSPSTSTCPRCRRSSAASCGRGVSDDAAAREGRNETATEEPRARLAPRPLLAERAHAAAGCGHTLRRSPGAVQITVLSVRVRRAVLRRELDLSSRPQTLGAVFSDQRVLLQGAGRDVARLRQAVRAPLDAGHDAGPACGAGADRRLRQSRRAHVLALQLDERAVRDFSARLERRRHVPDHGRHLRRGAALLRASPSRRRGRAVVRLQVVLVEPALHAHRAVARRRDDGRVSRSRRRRLARRVSRRCEPRSSRNRRSRR